MEAFWRNKRVVLTGGSYGIGKEMALFLAEYDCSYVICGRKKDRLIETQIECNDIISTLKGKGNCFVEVMDQSNMDDCKTFTGNCIKILGGVDVVIYNAAEQQFRPFDTYSEDEYLNAARSVFDTNFFSFLVLYRGFLPYLKKSQGTITVVSSGAGKMGSQFSSFYSASKAAVGQFLNAARKETMTVKEDYDHVRRCVAFVGLTKTDTVKNTVGDEITTTLTPKEVGRRILEITMAGSPEEGTSIEVSILLCLHSLLPGIINKSSLTYLPTRPQVMMKNPEWKTEIRDSL